VVARFAKVRRSTHPEARDQPRFRQLGHALMRSQLLFAVNRAFGLYS
jgi:hypothetical protein